MAKGGHRRVHGDDGGFVLLEALLTLFVVSAVLVGLLAGTFTVLMTSEFNRRQVRSGNEATTIVEAIRLQPYLDCAALTSYSVPTLPAGYAASVTKIEYLDDAASAQASFSPPPCSTDRGIQRVTVNVVAPGAPAAGSDLVFIKRRDTCPASIATIPGERC